MVSLVGANLTAPTLTTALVLLTLTAAAERLPVPAGLTTMSFAAVFIVAAAVLYGPAAAAVLAGVANLSSYGALGERKPLLRVAFNASQVSLAAAAAGFASEAVGGPDRPLAAVTAAAATFFAVNLGLVGGVVARAERHAVAPILLGAARSVAFPLALAMSVVPLFVVTWENSRAVALSSVVPLVAVGLYLRAIAASQRALELALTDPLTGLGNRRHFEERIRLELDRADGAAGVVTAVLIDLNGFKNVNDRYGHDVGDDLLRAVARVLRQGGEAFRLGGDEFVLLLPGCNATDAIPVVESVRGRIASLPGPGTPVTAAFGTATYDGRGILRDELLRSADRQLYADKQRRKGLTPPA